MIHGMKRSGNHAVINWLKAHDRFVFFNNIIPVAAILRGKRTVPPPEDFRLWLKQRLLSGNPHYPYFVIRFALRRQSLIVSLEDHALQVRPFFNVPLDVTNVLIVRDPYNLFASRIRKSGAVDNPAYPDCAGPTMDRVVDLWKTHAREALGLTSHLDNKVCVFFNTWYSSRDYRKALSRELNLEFTDEGFHEVSRIGGGSSFDSTAHDGDNRMMNVLDRQGSLTEPERELLETTIADEELQDLAQQFEQMGREIC